MRQVSCLALTILARGTEITIASPKSTGNYENSEKSDGFCFHSRLRAEQHMLPLSPKTTLWTKTFLVADRLASNFVGTDTIFTTLTLTLIEIFSNSNIYDCLYAELKHAIANSNNTAWLCDLENLPYLTLLRV